MSDSTEASERALRSLRDEGSGSSRTPLLSAKIERSLSPPIRPSSPDLTCAICLGDITDKSVTDSCFHRFCFSCLSEWSKVKPECPLCKARFTAIYHGIKSMNDFQVYRLDQSRNISHGGMDSLEAAAAAAALDPHIFINVAVQRAFTGRFGYRSTMGFNRTRNPGGHYLWGSSGGHDVMGPVPVSLPHPPVSGPVNLLGRSSMLNNHSQSSSSSSSSIRRAARHLNMEFRKNVYRQNLWARPNPDQDRIRESSPEFYRANTAQTHRLVPWLARELAALSEVGASFRYDYACRDILHWIRTFPINSADFKRNVQIYLGAQTEHFIHEFYQYAISPYDMTGYDSQARYTPSTAEQEVAQNGSDEDIRLDEIDMPLLPINLNVHDHMPLRLQPILHPTTLGRPTRNISGRPTGYLRPFIFPPSLVSERPAEPAAPPEVIVLSSSEENDEVEGADSDSEVQIIGSLPPLHLRPPEQVIDLDDSNDSDVIEIKAPTPPLIEIDDDGDDFSPQSPVAPSTSIDVAGPSGMQRDRRSSSRFFRPSYREYSSTSDDDDLPPKKRSLKKKNSSKKSSRHPSKRARAPKSTQFVDTSEDSDCSMPDEPKLPEKSSRRKTSRGSRSRQPEDHSSSRRDVDSEDSGSQRNSSSSSKTASKNSKKVSSDCTKCQKRRLSSSNRSAASSPELSRSKQQKRKRRKSSRVVSSDDSSQSRKKKKTAKDSDGSSSSSSLPKEAPGRSSSSSDDSYIEGANLARNPKAAMSRKAILLLKRAAEAAASSPDSPPAYRYGEMVELRSPTYCSMVLDNHDGYRGGNSFGRQWSEDSDTSSTLSMGTESAPPRDCEGLPTLQPSYSPLQSGPRSPSNSSFTSSARAEANSSPQSADPLPSSPSSQVKLTLKSELSGPPSVASGSAASSTTLSTASSPGHHSNDSWPELSASQPEVRNQSETQPASSPPNLRRFDDSPLITLEHSPLMSPPRDSSSWDSSSDSPSSPPRLKSVVNLPSSNTPESPSTAHHTKSDNTTSDEDDL